MSGPHDDFAAMLAAADAYRAHFGRAAPAYHFQSRPAALAAALWDAIARDVPLTEADLYAALDMTPPLPGAIL